MRRTVPRERLKTGSSMVQGSLKRNTAIAPPKPANRRAAKLVECALFDGNGEPPDQPCDLVQLAGIVILDRLSQASETFVVAHRRGFARDNRWHRPFEIGLELRHRITSGVSGNSERLQGISQFGVSSRRGSVVLSCGNPRVVIFVPEKADKPLRHNQI